MTAEYICECGKTFTKPNSFNGHKSNCKIHYLAKYGNLDKFKEKYAKSISNCSKSREDTANLRKKQKLEQWILEKHVCEKCGTIMTEKFGSGRFCSRACANSKTHTIETRKKISSSVISSEAHKRASQESHLQAIERKIENRTKLIEAYYNNPICFCQTDKKIPLGKTLWLMGKR